MFIAQVLWLRGILVRLRVPGNSFEGAVPNKEELFELLVESSVDFAMFTTDTNGLITSWNRGAERLFGYSEEQIIGRPTDVVFTAEDRAAGMTSQPPRRKTRTRRNSDRHAY